MNKILLLLLLLLPSSILCISAAHHRRTIVGGINADPARFPYFARLDYSGDFGCGGTLIHEDFVLTAAHCAYPEDLGSLSVTIGGYTPENGIPRKVVRIVPHAAYDDRITTSNDIALIQFSLEPSPQPASPVSVNSDRGLLTHGTGVTTLGLGKTQLAEKADTLQQVDLSIVSDEECDGLYDGDIHRKSMVCASGGGQYKDSCHGDSGGPLILLGETPESDRQVGVVSFGGQRCADATQPGVYADVAYFQSWIESVICRYSVNPPENCKVTVDSNVAPIYIGEDETCRDFPGAFYVNFWHQFQRCAWLRQGRQSQYCYRAHEAWVQCPLTCHSCTYETDDDIVQDDDWTNYSEVSSPVTLIFLLLFSCVLCCQVSCWVYRKRCRHAVAKPATVEQPESGAPQP